MVYFCKDSFAARVNGYEKFVRCSRRVHSIIPALRGQQIELADKLKYLGGIRNRNLSWKTDIGFAARKA